MTLVPHARSVGRVVVAGFGLPFPPGYLTDAKNLVLTDGTGKELPIHVKVLAHWSPPVPGAPCVRAVLIQFRDYMASQSPRKYTVRWGQPRRQNLAGGWPSRQDWLPVTDGMFPTGSVYDPPVWALLPPAWLDKCLLKGRFLTSGAQPSVDWIGQAQTNYFGHTINRPTLSTYDLAQKNVGQRFRQDYLTKFAPWLYDRAAAQFVLYLRTGKLAPLEAAHRSAQFYASQLEPNGKFGLLDKQRDVDLKYASQEGLTLDYFLTGDEKLLAATARQAKALDSWDPTYSPQRTFWTERQLGIGLVAAVAAYEMTGDPQLLQKARHLFEVGYRMQTEPPPGAPRDGCLIHTARQHGQRYDGWYCSPWMTALFVDAALRYYIITADPRVPQSAILMGQFMVKTATYRFTVGKGQDTRTYTFPYYMVSSLNHTGHDIHDDKMHALDTSKMVAAAYYFAAKLGQPREHFRSLFRELMRTAQWPIPKVEYRRQPSYINTPPRRFNWWFRITLDLGWLMSQN
ncbi:MAG: hypothetical protein C4525_09030 [Desulfarculus sp.]|nr:MAG: hypothetical protein C4525_09030 [Desulfarculus sp.]